MGDAPKEYGPAKTLYKRWSDDGDFARIMVGLAAAGANPNTVMIDATFLKAQRTACSLHAKTGRGRRIALGNGGLNRKLHAITDAESRPVGFHMLAGQVSDHTGGGAAG